MGNGLIYNNIALLRGRDRIGSQCRGRCGILSVGGLMYLGTTMGAMVAVPAFSSWRSAMLSGAGQGVYSRMTSDCMSIFSRKLYTFK